MDRGLLEGVQTKITKKVKKECKKIKGTGLDYLANAIKHIHKNYKKTNNFKKYFQRLRTAEEIILSKRVTGCTDYAHLFIVLLRNKKIPAYYIETFENNWLKKPIKGTVSGHVFVKVKLRKEEVLIDPTAGSINFRNNYGNYTPMLEGIDFLTIFKNKENYIQTVKKHFNIKF